MFSKTTEYALRATIYIARKSSEEKKIGIWEIANAIDSPKSFTAKILQMLTGNKKIVSSMHGPNGGFYMTKEAKKLPVRAVLRAVNEDEVLTKCILGLKECSDRSPCPLHEEYRNIRRRLTRLFESSTIEDLATGTKGNLFVTNKKIRSSGQKSPPKKK